ncbi:MAG: PTS sugar transporter subunit IIA, partial [Treponema sp.]|nr:PTS sugar transporter subunit IIA [Treponema sp.]
FNRIGALRIGMGMIPRGEGALISCGIGLAAGVIDNRLFAAAVFMIFLTIVFSPPLLGFVLKIQRQGTRKPVKNDDSVQETWDFESVEIADLVLSNLLRELRNGGFFVQTMNVDEGLSQAHKGDIALFLTEEKKSISIATSKTDMPLVKNEMYEVIIELSNVIDKLKFSADAAEMKKELFDIEARTTKDILALIDADQFIMDLKGGTKEEIIAELVDILAANDKLINKEQVIADVLEREDTMSTGMEHGVALPHAKTDGIAYNAVAIGVKREGIHFDSMDGELSRLFVLIVSPKKASGLHIQFLAAVGSLLSDEDMCEMVINAASPQDAVDLLRKKKNGA